MKANKTHSINGRIKTATLLFTFLFLILSNAYAFANQSQQIITKSEKGTCEIQINGAMATKYECNGFNAPSLITSSYLYESNEYVYIFIDNPMGNACDGGPIHVISQNDDGLLKSQKTIDFCGGHYPTVITEPKKLSIFIPSIKVEGTSKKIPGEKWVFENNVLTKVR
ncbi:hypothetical protein J1782_05050 [Rahnella sp. BCC 1045]|uniref:hypothetical protein n=1 Tax=Rahnella sp. BCC 1045 TaxID=2816251 RepID=UPI001C272399|nr:hypothetical protein [Rahnella sp. BCC 1045]MBU9819250.1 hypothetical protein [Rahnella sp. BCC 1045]